MSYEDPYALLRRLKLGREEFCQRLLTALILGGPYPPWNTRSSVSPAGAVFLQRLDTLSFGQASWADGGTFVDELDLPRRHDNERGGAPDQAVLWPHRLWLIELKTEAASHRGDQLPSYYRLAAHHYPGVPVDITYLTPPLDTEAPVVEPPNRYAHVTWGEVAGLVAATWPASGDDGELAVRDMLLNTIAGLALSARVWRERVAHVSAGPPPVVGRAPAIPAQMVGVGTQPHQELLREAATLARRTAADGEQRGFEAEVGSLEVLQQLRLEVRQVLSGEPAGSPARRVLPWLWNASISGGQPLTGGGAAHGYELRFSRYRRPVL